MATGMRLEMNEDEMRDVTQHFRTEGARLPNLMEPPTWEQLGWAFGRVESADAAVEDLVQQLKEAKEEAKQAQGALRELGLRVTSARKRGDL